MKNCFLFLCWEIDTVNADIGEFINFLAFMKIGKFAPIKTRILSTIDFFYYYHVISTDMYKT